MSYSDGEPANMDDYPTEQSRQCDREIAADDRRASLAWTKSEYERLRESVQALVRTHIPIDLPDGRTLSGVDGHLFWQVLQALDREFEPRGPGRPKRKDPYVQGFK